MRGLVARLLGLRREEGAATIEFVILLPVFLVMIISGFEAGMLMTRQLMLERGLDMTMRSLRLGTFDNPSHDTVKAEICRRAIVIPNCMDAVQLDMQPVSMTTWQMPISGQVCVDRRAKDLDPTDGGEHFKPGARSELMMVRACAAFKPFFPTVGLGTQLPRKDGEYWLVATSGFMNEP